MKEMFNDERFFVLIGRELSSREERKSQRR